MLEDGSRAHPRDILKANSAVTADAENPFITLKLPLSAEHGVFDIFFLLTTKMSCILFETSEFSSLCLCHCLPIYWKEALPDNVSVQYLIPPDWLARHTVNSRSNGNFLLASKLINFILRPRVNVVRRGKDNDLKAWKSNIEF